MRGVVAELFYVQLKKMVIAFAHKLEEESASAEEGIGASVRVSSLYRLGSRSSSSVPSTRSAHGDRWAAERVRGPSVADMQF